MTTDEFTEAARAEAERRTRPPGISGQTVPSMEQDAERDGYRRGFMDAAEWARDHLAAQEPTDAEVEAVARVIFMAGPSTDGTIAAWDGYPEHVKTRCLEKAREVLSAARRDEENR